MAVIQSSRLHFEVVVPMVEKNFLLLAVVMGKLVSVATGIPKF